MAHSPQIDFVLDMSIEPSQKLPETDSGESKTEKMPLKPGKGYGIIALLCGLLPIFILPFNVVFETYIGVLGLICCLFSPIVGLVFGIMGRKTEGRLYAYTGLILCLLFGLLLFSESVMFYIYFVVLEHPK